MQSEEILRQLGKSEKADVMIQVLWLVLVLASIGVWVFCFEMQGLIYLFIVEAFVFAIAMILKSGLRKTILQLQNHLLKETSCQNIQ